MWNASKNNIPESNIRDEHMRALEEAVNDCMHYDIRSNAVYEALDYLQNDCTRTWGFTLFRQGLENWSPKALHEGLGLIKKHLSQ